MAMTDNSGRGGFSNKLGFILAAAGSAVGLGNIWKFPFEVADGGGAAFLILYLGFCFILCFPVMVAEIAIGRNTNKNPVGAFTALKGGKFRLVGLLGILSGFLILSFYNVVAGWAFGYFIEMVSGNYSVGGDGFGSYIADWKTVGAYGLIFMLITAFIVSRGVSGGIEKAAKILMPTLIVMILGLMIYAFTLPNAGAGIEFYLVPDFSEITFTTIYTALSQAFFSLSLGMGALITYGSYVGKKDNVVSSAAYITLFDVGIAFIAGLMMFPLVAYLSNGDMNAIEGGPGLIFATLPGVFETLGPVLGRVIGGAFFLLLSFAALTSTVSLLEVPVAYVVDEHKVRRPVASWAVAGIIFLIGIPSLLANGAVSWLTEMVYLPGKEKVVSFMDIVEVLANDTFLPLGGCLISIFVIYRWKKNNFNAELEQGNEKFAGSFMQKYLNVMLSYVAPVVLAVIFLLTVLNLFFGVTFF